VTPSNSIHIATSSIDGNVCVASLVDPKDVLLRNFGRPVQSVAISPDYKNDRTYISGGRAGNLVLTVGGRAGTSSTSSTASGSAINPSGWLGAIGLGSNTGKDTILHSGEGSINSVKWSLSGKYVVWVNEQGIKIMRSNLHLEGVDSDFAWKRVGHVDRPSGQQWEDMGALWKARVEWVDEKGLEGEEEENKSQSSAHQSSAAEAQMRALSKSSRSRDMEKLLIGWGGTVWVINVHHGGPGKGKHVGERTAGRAEIVKL
jgi:vacuolar protein sorting-associated protein 41